MRDVHNCSLLLQCFKFIFPIKIFKRLKMISELKTTAPDGSLVKISETGYTDPSLFVKWLEFFTATVHSSAEKKVLLCLNSNTTHN